MASAYPNEPPPESVITYEMSNASARIYYNYAASTNTAADDGLGDPAVITSDGRGLQSSGERWQVKMSPGQTFTVTCSPSSAHQQHPIVL